MQLAFGLGFVEAKGVEFRDLVKESFLRRDGDDDTPIAKQYRLTKLLIP